MYRQRAVQSQSAAVVHEGLTPGAAPNGGPQLAKREGTSTGKVKATVAGRSKLAAASLHSSGRSHGTQRAQSRHQGIASGAARGHTTNNQSNPRAGKAGHALTRQGAAQPAGLTNERGGLGTREEGTEARRNCRPTRRTEGYSPPGYARPK